LFGRNIGGNERSTNGPPGKGTFCQEKCFGIMLPGFAFVIDPVTVRSYNNKIGNENQVVANLERVVHMR
jgi:hypothetical protein